MNFNMFQLNWAKGMPAYQSSTQYPEESNTAGHAVDGNINGDLYDGSCTLTKTYDTNPWWMVDLVEVILSCLTVRIAVVCDYT